METPCPRDSKDVAEVLKEHALELKRDKPELRECRLRRSRLVVVRRATAVSPP